MSEVCVSIATGSGRQVRLIGRPAPHRAHPAPARFLQISRRHSQEVAMPTQTSHDRPSRAPSRNGAHVRSYPAPRPLATPTDLKPDEVRAVVEAVNPLIADAYALYVKTKNYHWHLAGSHFRDYHLLFDEQADALFASIDPLAAPIRRIGGTTIPSISHTGQLQTIADANADFVSPEEMIQSWLEDNRHIAGAQRAAIEICDKNRDTPTGNLLQEILDQT